MKRPINIILYLTLLFFTATYSPAQSLISSEKNAWASSAEGGNVAANGVDGKANTRWGSNWSQDTNPADAWWVVDLGDAYYISRIEFDWEAAYATEYAIEISNDPNFGAFTEIAYVTNGKGQTEVVTTDINSKGRYVRFRGITRNTGYGYSFWECRVYGVEELTSTEVQLHVPYVQYLKLKLTPSDLNNNEELVIQNKDELVTLNYNIGTPLRIDLLDFRGDFYVALWTFERGTTDTITGLPLSVMVYEDMKIHVDLTPKITFGNQPPVADAGKAVTLYAPQNSVQLDGSRSQDKDGEIVSYNWFQVSGPAEASILSPNKSITVIEGLGSLGDYKFRLTVVDDEGAGDFSEVVVSVLPPEQVDFGLLQPIGNSMVTDTRRPQFTWEGVDDAIRYEIFVNITRKDYEWHTPGNLLDRYTKVGESVVTSFSMPFDLVDRWTYKWYVVAHTTSGEMYYSNKQQFGLYMPVLEQENDGISIVEGCRDLNKNGTIEPFEDWRLSPEERLADLMQRMTSEEKISQLFYGGNENPLDGFAFSYGVESGMRNSQYNAAKTRLGIPIAFLGDKMHGWKTIYPTQIGLAATRDMNLTFACADLHRIEQKSFGFTGTLAPVAEVATKVLYPRIQEGSGENAEEVAASIRALVCGMQGGPEVNPHSMLVTVKHWPSQGAGGEGPTQYDAVTIKYHMKPWYAAVDANAASVMPGYSSSPFLDPGGAGSNSSKKIIDYLRNEVNFNGFIVTDWLAATTKQSIESIGAGIDVLGGAPSAPTDFAELVNAVGMDRIDEAVSKVLDIKIRLGMLENPYSDPTCTWTNTDHHQIVLDAARKSVTLLKNDSLIPFQLSENEEIVVDGPRAHWSSQNDDPNVIWQSIYYDNKQTRTYLQALTERGTKENIVVSQQVNARSKVAVVVIGERSYTHGTDWADKNPDIPEEQLDVLRIYKELGLKTVAVVLLPRPYVLTPLLDVSDVVIATYRGGNGIGQAVAEALFGDYAPSGKLPFQLPRSAAQVGTDRLNDQIERWELPYDIGASESERAIIRNYIDQDQPVPPVFGDPLFQYGFGLQNFGYEENYTNNNRLQAGSNGDKRLLVYPNPVKKYLYIKSSSSATGDTFIVTDIRGVEVKRIKLHSSSDAADVSDLKSGLYILRSLENRIATKFVKQ